MKRSYRGAFFLWVQLMILALMPARAVGQSFLNMVESPAGAGLFVDRFSGEYLQANLTAGVTRLFNAAAGDRVTVLVETSSLRENANPRVRLTDAGGVLIAEVTGDQQGRVVLENQLIADPGVYTLTIYSTTESAEFTADVMLGRQLELESELNDFPLVADVPKALPVAGGFEVRAAGSLGSTLDWFALGELAVGSAIDLAVVAPANSLLNPEDLSIALFKEGDPVPVTTVSGGALSFTPTEAASYLVRLEVPSLDDKALQFDGTAATVNLGNPVALQISGDQTVEFWVNPARLGKRQNPYEKAYGGEGTMTIEPDGLINYYYGSGGDNNNPYLGVPSVARVRPNEWTHVAMVRDLTSTPKTVTWYFNGQQVAQQEVTIFPAATSVRDFLIGNGYAGYFEGELDEFRVWNVARSAVDIANHYAVTLTGSEGGLVAYYRFNEAGGTDILDGSSNGLNGTITGTFDRSGAGGSVAAFAASQSLGTTYFLSAEVDDLVAPTVVRTGLSPLAPYLFNGTTAAPSNMEGERGNIGSEFFYTVRGTTSGTLKGTGVYSDDSSPAKAAVHAGILRSGEVGTVKVTITGDTRYFQASSNHGVASSFDDFHPGSFTIEPYAPLVAPTLDGLYPGFWVAFSEPVDPSTLDAVTLSWAGPDGVLATADDENFPVSLISVEDHNRAVFGLDGKVLQAGVYRLRVAASLADRAANTLASPYTEDFTIASNSGYVNESGEGDTFATSTLLSLSVDAGTFDGSFVDGGVNQSSSGDSPFDVGHADFDGDGHEDVVVGYQGSGEKVSVFPGNGDGTFGTPVEFPASGDVWDVELIDYNKDGKTDVVASARNIDAVLLLQNTSTPGVLSFVQQANLPVGDDPRVITTGDFNKDTWPDLAVSNYGTNGTTGRSVSLLLNDQSGGFTPSLLEQGTMRAFGLSAADLNGDTNPDLVVGDIDNGQRIGVMLGNGDGTFGAPAFYDYGAGWDPSGIAIADFNQDLAMDLVVMRGNWYARELSIYPGVGDGTFGERINQDLGGGGYYYHFEQGDFTGDGWPDLMLGGYDRLTLLQNTADGSFGFRESSRNPGRAYGVAVADFDEDGTVDLLSSDENNDLLRFYAGQPRAFLLADDSNVATGLLHGYGRGYLSDNNDVDYFRFSAKAGQLVNLAVDTTGQDSANLYYIVEDSEGNDLFAIAGPVTVSGPRTIPRDGTYFVRVSPNAGHYNREYRFRVSLAPAGSGQQESENNDSINNSDGLAFTQSGTQLSARIYGVLMSNDGSGDYYNLGNLAEDTEVRIRLDLPSTSTLDSPALTLFKSDGSAITPDSLSPTELLFQLGEGDASTYFLRVSGGTRSSLAEYFVNVSLTDLVPPSVVADSLPDDSTDGLVTGFSLTFNKDMLPSSINNASNYSLVWAGPDGLPSTPDDVAVTIVSSGYSSGLTASYALAGAPIPAGDYLFRATGLRDIFGNEIPVPYEKAFSVGSQSGAGIETESNNSTATATPLPLDDSIPGYLTANARGLLIDSPDVDYWSFEGESGDLFVFETFLPFVGSTTSLYYRVYRPDGSLLWERRINSSELESAAPVTLPETGTYVIQIDDWNSVRSEYRFRVTLVRAGIDYETEGNGDLGSANPVNYNVVNNINTAVAAGFISGPTQLDFFDLGTIDAGTTVFLSTRAPSGSGLSPIVSLYNSAGQIMNEVSGTPNDSSVEVPISETGVYYGLVRANIGTSGLDGTYVLDIRTLPTAAVDFPNLQVTAVDDVTTPGIRSGDAITFSYTVTNTGSLQTGSSAWVDRVVLSSNDVYGDGDDLQLAVIPHTGALSPSAFYVNNPTVVIPDGLSGDFYLIVRTDSSNAVDEIFKEGDNSRATSTTFPVQLQDYPDLVIEDFGITGPDPSGLYQFDWKLANRGTGDATGNHTTRITILNTTTSQVVLNQDLDVIDAIGSGLFLSQATSLTTTTPGFYLITITADADREVYEYNVSGHGAAEANSLQDNFQIFEFFDIMVSASPGSGGSVSGGGTYRDGFEVTVSATPDTSVLPYRFVNWTENGVFVSANATYTFTAGSDRNLVAVFALPQFQVVSLVSPPGSGSVSGAGTYALNATASLTANPSPGYLFDRWEEGATNLGSTNPLAFNVTGARTVTAVFREANPTHLVTLATAPPDLVVIPGGATYANGEILNATAPLSVIRDDSEFLFKRWVLNGLQLNTNPVLSKTFSTLDPPVMAYLADYEERSLLPVLTSVTSNFGTLVPLSDAVVFTVNFDRDMNTSILPGLTLSSGTASVIPPVPTGAWVNARQYRSGPTSFGSDSAGAFALTVGAATDTNGRVMAADSSFGFTVDGLPPENPVPILTGTTSSAATVGWAGYPAPADLGSFRYYLETSPFTSVSGLSPVSGAGKTARSATFTGLEPDTDYYAAIIAVDAAGNITPTVTPLSFRLATVLPPPVNPTLARPSITSARLDWAAYDRTLIGLEGFRIYRSTTPFTTVDVLTPVAEVDRNTTQYLFEGLDRLDDHHFAVVAFNRNDEQVDEVTPVLWQDPLRGTLAESFTIGGEEEVILIHGDLVLSGGATLTILPGTTLAFAPGTGLSVQDGILVADGSARWPVHFTSAGEFSDPPTAARGDWSGVTLGDPTKVSTLRHLWLRFGSGLQVTGGEPVLSNYYAVQNSGAGLDVSGGTVNGVDLLLTVNENGARATGTGSLTLTNSILKSNSVANAVQSGGGELSAERCFWGTPTASGLEGIVSAGSLLANEPVLGGVLAVRNGEDRTATRDIVLFLGAANGVSFRLSEDSLFPSVAFDELFEADDDFRFSPYGFELPFRLSQGGGLKTVFGQLRSESDQPGGNLSVPITLVTDGPVVGSFSLTEGQVVDRPITVTGTGSAPLGVARTQFLVDGVVLAQTTTGALSFEWDPRSLPSGIKRAVLAVSDNYGGMATREVNVTVAPGPPPRPVIASPSDGTLTNNATVTVQGSAEPGVTVQVTRNGAVIVSDILVPANGQFVIPDVPLVEGANVLVVSAADFLGSSSSLSVSLTYDSGPPAAPNLLRVVTNDLSVEAEWEYQGDEEPTRYGLYWNPTSFDDPSQASKKIENLTLANGNFTFEDGNWFVGVVAFDAAGNASPLSNLRQISVDFSRPVITVSYDQAMPVGPGLLGVQVESNEALDSVPSMTIRSAGSSSPIAITLAQQTSTLFTGQYQVSAASSRSGNAAVRVSARDLAGNVFSGTPQGESLSFDVTKPTAIITLDEAAPIQTTSPRTLTVGLTLSESLEAGTEPVLRFEPPVGAIIDLPLTGSGLVWSGQLPVNAAMGSGEGFFRFNGTDPAGNDGTVITENEILELYNSALPNPPGQVTQVRGEILSGGRIRIDWTPAARAESYKLFREPGSEGGVPTLLVEGGIEALSYVDTPPVDGPYRYAVVSELRGAEGPPSGILVAESDRLPPEVPESFSVQLLASGVEISFAAPASGPIPSSYRIYRGATLLRTVSTPEIIRDYPARGAHDYRVASVDQYGNENPTAPITIELSVSPVRDLHLNARRGSASSLTWQNIDNTVVGFNVYRDGVKQNGAPLATAAYVDSLGSGGRSVLYEVSAVNGAGDESLRREVRVFPIDLRALLNPGQEGSEGRSFAGYFDRLRIEIENRAAGNALELEAIEINRMVTGEDDLTQTNDLNLTVAPATTEATEVVLPAPVTVGAAQNYQVILESLPSSGGSRVTYEFNFEKDLAVRASTPASLRTAMIPVAGANANVEVTLRNAGGAPMEVILGRESGTMPGDVAIEVTTAEGEVVSRTEFKGLGATGTVLQTDGRVTVTIAPGQTFTFTVPDVVIPEYLGPLGDGAFLSLNLSNLYSGLGTSNSVMQSTRLSAQIFTRLLETPYYGELQTDKDAYVNEETIMISGRALARETDLPEANVPLRIGFEVQSYVFYEEVTTDENGDYTLEFTPPKGFSGALNIWAAHPLVVDQLKQKTIQFRRFYTAPGTGQIVLSKNDTLDFQITLANPGDLPLENIALNDRVFITNEGVETDIDTISAEILTPGPLNLEPYEVRKVDLRVTSALDAPDAAVAVLNFVSQGGASAEFRGFLSLRPAVPVLSFTEPSVGYVDLSVNRGEIASTRVVLENKGLRALEGVEVIPPSTLGWMDVTLPRDENGRILLPDVPVGGKLVFTVAYAPPQGTALGLYDDLLLIRGSNLQSDFQVNLFAQITSSERGSVKFFVDNIFAEPVPNAKIRLRNPNLRANLGPFFTDSLGEVTIPDLQEGGWSYQITASGHTTATGSFDVRGGQTAFATHRLSKSLVTVEFTVTPVPFTDRYEITIEQTFETRVPVPNLVMDPPATQLFDLPDVAEGTIMVDVKNVGLASLFEVIIRGQSANYGSLVPLVRYLPELKAQETVTIPFKWTWDITGLVDRDAPGAEPSNFDEQGIENILARRQLADQMANALSYPETGNSTFDFCAGNFGSPFPDIRGLAALTEGLACCPDGAPLAAGAAFALTAYSTYSFISSPAVTIGTFLGCLASGLFDGIGGGGGGGGSSGPSTSPGFGPGGGCFVTNTLVEVPNAPPVPIQDLKTGQLVRTGEKAGHYAAVEEVITREADNLHRLSLKPMRGAVDEKPIVLTGTGDHYVWSDSSGWTRIDQLKPGDFLHHHDGRLFKLLKSELLEGSHTVHTLSIKDDTAFYANGLLVQELCGDFELRADPEKETVEDASSEPLEPFSNIPAIK